MVKLLKNLKPYWLSIIGIILFVFLQAIAELFLPTLMSNVVDIGVVNGDTGYILRIGGLMLLIAFIAMAASILGSYLSSRLSIGFARDLRRMVFSKIESFSLEDFNEKGTDSLIVRTTNDITQIQQLTVTLFRMFLRAPMLFIGGIIMAFSKNTELALLLLGILPVLSTIIYFVAKKSMSLFQAMQIKVDNLNSVLREYLSGLRVIRAFNREEYEKERFNESNYDLTETARKVSVLMASLMPLMILVLNLTIVAIFWLGSIKIDLNIMQVGDLMAFVQYALQIMFSLIMFSMMFVMFPRASVSATRINEVLDVETKIKDPISPVSELLMEEDTNQGTDIRHHTDSEKNREVNLKFENVSFCYQDATEYAVCDISFQAKPGEVTAIIGSTGSGKTTLVNLIPRFYDITKGSISINNIDIRDITQENLREIIGLVPQKATLFTGTVAENISFGNDMISREEIKRVAEIAQADNFIEKMAEGYESFIAQGGRNLSGGEKQRISIARALAKHPEIFIFDDSFSALDFKTESRLREAIKKEISGKVVLIIAQRVTTVMGADQIIVLDKGRIVGIGSHKELIRTSEVYKEIVASQLSEEGLYE